MAEQASLITRALTERLERAGSEGLKEAVLVATTCKSVPGATPAAVQAAIRALVQRQACVRKNGRVLCVTRATVPPRTPAELSALDGLNLPRLGSSAIELEIDLPEDEEEEEDLARSAAPGPRREPSEAQVRAVAWLIENERGAALAIAEAFAGRVHGGGRPRAARSGDRDERSFGVLSVRVRRAVGGRSTLVLNGWCGWDEEHGFGIELDGTEVIETGGASEIR